MRSAFVLEPRHKQIINFFLHFDKKIRILVKLGVLIFLKVRLKKMVGDSMFRCLIYIYSSSLGRIDINHSDIQFRRLYVKLHSSAAPGMQRVNTLGPIALFLIRYLMNDRPIVL